MKNRYRMYVRGKHSGSKIWWCEDSQTGKRESLRTTDKAEAWRLLDLKNQPYKVAAYHRQMARGHLMMCDPTSADRTWQMALQTIILQQKGSSKARWERVAKSKSLDPIRDIKIADTKAEDIFNVLADGKVSTNVYLRRLHNYALGVHWLLAPVIDKERWPKVKFKDKRPITLAEHQKIIEREKNPERKAFYELCWHTGGAQSDIANLTSDAIDWKNRTVRYYRKKTGELSYLSFEHQGPLMKVLQSLPATGQLFPYLCSVRESDRATEFKQRCTTVGISGVTLHSYRYQWAERAKANGYPERYAQTALGHGSKAVARAYAGYAELTLPSLESFENAVKEKIVTLPTSESKAA